MKPVKTVRETHADFTCIVTLSSTILDQRQFVDIRNAIKASLVEPLAAYDLVMTEIGQNTKRIMFGGLLLSSANFTIEADLKDLSKEPVNDAS